MTVGVSPLDGGDGAAAGTQFRASHEDRDRVVEQLRMAAGDGMLTADELDQRLGAALTACTRGELAVLIKDLPGVPDPGPDVSVSRPADVVRIDGGSGSAKRDGRWVVPRRMDVRVASGKVVLDFTEAVLTHPAIQIDVDVRSGRLVLVTRPGIVVETADVTVRSGEVKVRMPWGPQVPVTLRIDVAGQVGSGTISVRPRRRSFLQSMRRMWQHLADE